MLMADVMRYLMRGGWASAGAPFCLVVAALLPRFSRTANTDNLMGVRPLQCCLLAALVGCGSSSAPAVPDPPAPPSPDAAPSADAAELVDAAADVTLPGEAPASTCGSMTFGEGVTPDVLLVYDRSASNTHHAETVSALAEVLAATESNIHWGLQLYPAGDDACMVAAAPEVPPGEKTAAAITQALMAHPPGTGAGAPLASAVGAAMKYLDASSLADARYLVLVTAGVPSCPANAQGESVMALSRAAEDAIATFVLAAGTPAGLASQSLSALATAGGQARAGTPPYLSTKSELLDALATTSSGVSSCLLPLDMVPPAPANVLVRLKGQRLTRDPTHTDGWDYGPAMMSIAFYGVACDRVKTSHAGEVEVFFGCLGGPAI
jgi:hypothetical protein